MVCSMCAKGGGKMGIKHKELWDLWVGHDDFYDAVVFEELLEDDELGAFEEGFMQGYMA